MGHTVHVQILGQPISSWQYELLTVKEELQLVVEELFLGPGGGEAGGAQPDRVDEPHAVELDLLPAALPAEDLAAAAAVVLQQNCAMK